VNNSRALKQLKLLSQNSFEITVLDISSQESFPDPEIPNVNWKHLSLEGEGPSFFRRLHSMIRQEASQIVAEYYHASDLYVLPALSKAATKYKAKLIYDSRELYPYVASTTKKPWSSLFWRFLESKYINKADQVFTVSDSISKSLSDMYGIPRPEVIWNIPEATDYTPNTSLRDQIGLSSSHRLILHQGQIKKSRGCQVLIEAIGRTDEVHCVFLGGGSEKAAMQDFAKSLALEERIHFLNPVPSNELLGYTSGANIGVSLLEDTCLNHRFALPNKFFEYLQAGIPVIASELPEVSSLVQEYDVGWLATPGELLNQKASNSRALLRKMNWEIAGRRFVDAYKNLE